MLVYKAYYQEGSREVRNLKMEIKYTRRIYWLGILYFGHNIIKILPKI